jgi:uncharacterized membrane protein YkvA (DUF1232 family)
MPLKLARVRALLVELPKQGRLAYCLLRDERVPRAPKAALLGALGLIASPLDFPAWIPVVGELDLLALGILAVKVFVEACPEELVKEHEEALGRGDSLFHRDVRGAASGLRELALGAVESVARRRSGGQAQPRLLEDESA